MARKIDTVRKVQTKKRIGGNFGAEIAVVAHALIGTDNLVKLDPDDMVTNLTNLLASTGSAAAISALTSGTDLTAASVLTTLATNVGLNTTEGASLAQALAALAIAEAFVGTIESADATTPVVSTATGKTNTGYMQVKGKTSGSLKVTAADAMAYALTVAAAAQTVGNATLTIPNVASVSDSFVLLALAQELTNKTLTAQIVKTGLTASGSAANDFSGSTGTFKTSTGVNTIGGNMLIKTIATPVAAAGAAGGVAGAAALGAANIVTVSSDGATKGVKLLTGVAGDVKQIINTSSTACNLFAASGGTINGGSPDVGCAIPASKGVIAICTAADSWVVMDMTARAGAAA